MNEFFQWTCIFALFGCIILLDKHAAGQKPDAEDSTREPRPSLGDTGTRPQQKGEADAQTRGG